MTKKKSDSSTTSIPDVNPSRPAEEPVPPKGRESAAKPTGEKEASKKQPPRSTASSTRKRGLTEAEIGSVAGETWNVLSQQGGQSLTALKKSIDAPGDLVAAAIGWLAREGKLELQTKGRTVRVSLR